MGKETEEIGGLERELKDEVNDKWVFLWHLHRLVGSLHALPP